MLGIPAVAANPILDFVQEKAQWLFFDLGSNADDQVLVLRVLLFIVLFSLLYAITSIGPMAHFPGNARTMLSIAISLISVVIIPMEVLVSISAAYGAFFTLLLLGVPTVGVAYLVLTKLSEETVANYSLKAIVCLALFYVLNAYDLTVGKSTELSTIASTISSLVSTLSLVFMLYGFYSLYSAVSVHGKGKVATGGAAGAWKSLFGGVKTAKFDEARAKTLLGQLDVSIKANNPAQVLANAASVKSEVVHVLETIHAQLEAELVVLQDSPVKKVAEKKLGEVKKVLTDTDNDCDKMISLANGVAGGAFSPAVMTRLNTGVALLRKDLNNAIVLVPKLKEWVAQAQAAPATP